ncbi:[RNA-polymerase]-subunit kinase protein [Dioscorea alata]|uniref:[RNA-polymerase]-subunit kinase protein n=1 Tax=Dioscorea alata TaxID=55571 RepID=A0ACB7W0B8_DIOAL|nr:[RNA-polymerase]-subunit kinase protein [Dioscorea alata]
MAAARHGGCRFNEIGKQGFHGEFQRRKEYYQDRFLDGNFDGGRARDFKGRSDIMHGEIKKLDLEVRRCQSRVSSPPSRKRKLSQILSDGGDDKQSQNLVSGRKNHSVEDGVDPNRVFEKFDVELPENPVAEMEDDRVHTRNISTSRWADVDDEDDEARAGSSPEVGEIVTRGSSRSSGAKSSESEQSGASHSDGLMDVDGGDDDADFDSLESSPPKGINMLQGCRSVDEFEKLNKVNEGTYGVVYRARDKKTGEIVALKKVKMEKEREGFPITSLREINILLSSHHPSIVEVKEVVIGSSLDSIFMVMEFMDHDLKGLMDSMKQPFSQSDVKCLMLQLLEGVKYLHDNWVLHRDLKTSNLLLNNRGELKICDFGLSRQYGSPLKPYTQLVVTLWYRAPELLLGAKQYSTAIDMWSLGCIMAELLTKEPLFKGKTEMDQLDKIFKMLGTPNDEIWPGFSKLVHPNVKFTKQKGDKLREKFRPTFFSGHPVLSLAGLDLLRRLLCYNPAERITAEEALQHEWFREVPLPKSKDFLPTFPSQNTRERNLGATLEQKLFHLK